MRRIVLYAILFVLLTPFVIADASPVQDFNYNFDNNAFTYAVNIRNFYDAETNASIVIQIKDPSTKEIIAVDSFYLFLDQSQERKQIRKISSVPNKDYVIKIKMVSNNSLINSDDEFKLSEAKKYLFDKNTIVEQKVNASDQEFDAEDISCTPDYCSNGLTQKDFYCNAIGCYRTCQASICKQQWSQIYSSTQSWESESNYDSDSSGFSSNLGQYTNFQKDKCYQVNTWSDNYVVDESDIKNYDNDKKFDSVLGLTWELVDPSNNRYISAWNQPCYSGDDGTFMDEKDHYLIDDNDNGNDFSSADALGGSWTGYCSDTCSNMPGICTTKCYGSKWNFRINAEPDVENGYETLNPTNSQGACNAESGDDTGNPKIDYIDFNDNDYAGMTVWESPIEIKSEAYSCQCDYGSCCENKKFKSSWSQPTGYTDYYYLVGDNSAATTKACILKDYQCTGNNQEFITTENTKQTCGKCQYCTSNGCKNYAEGTDCGNNMKCNANGQCVACFKNTDCGIDSLLNQPFCSNNDISDKKKIWTCNNPGTGNAYCSSATTDVLKQDCGDNSYGAWGTTYCSSLDGDIVHTRDLTNRTCLSNQCTTINAQETQIVTDCQYGCKNGQCALPVCFNNADCGQNQWQGTPFCSNDDVYQNQLANECNNANTIYAACTQSTKTVLKTDCEYGCIMENGIGICDPNAPPSVTYLTADKTDVKRTESVKITCEVTDLNGNNDIASVKLEFKTSSETWQTLASTSSAELILPPTAALGKYYDIKCTVADAKGKIVSKIEDDIFTVVDYPLEFTLLVNDHTSKTEPAIKGSDITFTTNIYDPDSMVKLIICDQEGLQGQNCKTKEYCSQGFKQHGEFTCKLKTSMLESGEYTWTSFGINDLNQVTTGATGTFNILGAALNPQINLETQQLWLHKGYFTGIEMLNDFNAQLQTALENCKEDDKGICALPLFISTDSPGFIDIINLNIEYYIKENIAPQIALLENLTVYEGDIVSIKPKIFDPNGDEVIVSISEPIGDDGVWQTTEIDSGEYLIIISVSDGKTTTEETFTLTVLESIDQELGGVIKHGDVTMTIFPGSLPPDKFTHINIDDLDENAYVKENNLEVIGKVYAFSPSGIIFNPPIKVEITYNESEVKDEDKLDAYLYKLIDDKNQMYKWTPLGAEINKENNILAFYLTHFSEYAIQEVVFDINPPQIEIQYPQPIIYYDLFEKETIDVNVVDDTDSSPVIQLFVDGQIINQPNFKLSTLSQGIHTLKVIAADQFGNSNSKEIEFSFETTNAPITTTSVSDTWHTSDVTLTLVPEIKTTESSNSLITYYCMDTVDSCMPAAKGNTVKVTENGINYVRFYSVNGKNKEQVKSVKVKIDKQPPHVLVTGLPESEYNNLKLIHLTEPTTITLVPVDNESGIKEFICEFNKKPCDNKVIINEQGTHLLTYQAFDNVGKTSYQVQLGITLDSLSPMTIITPDKEWLSPQEAFVHLTCKETNTAGYGCSKIFFEDKVGDVISVENGLDLNISLSYKENMITEHILTYNAMDKFGNEEPVQTKSVKIDAITPEILIISPGNKAEFIANETINIDYIATDQGSGVKKTTIVVNNNIINNVLNKASVKASELSIGKNILKITVEDNVGNTVSEESFFTVKSICSSDPECNDAFWHNDLQCKENNVIDLFTSYICKNPGTVNAYCEEKTQENVKTECKYGCEYGLCLGKECSTCKEYCDFKTYTFYGDPVCSNKVIFRTNAVNGNYIKNTWVGITANNDEELDIYTYGGTTEFIDCFKPVAKTPEDYNVCVLGDNKEGGEIDSLFIGKSSGDSSAMYYKEGFSFNKDLASSAPVSVTPIYLYSSTHKETYEGCTYNNIIEHASECGWKQPVCIKDDDCGISGWQSETLCDKEKDLYQKYTSYSCKNPGTPSAECITNGGFKFVQTCSNVCSDGQCQESTNSCDTIICKDYCDGTTLYTASCSNGICSYSMKENTTECLSPQMNKICNNNLDCGVPSSKTETICSEGKIYQNYIVPICVDPSTPNAYCNNIESYTLKETCTNGCLNNVCKEKACQTMTCKEYCDGTTYYSNATCSLGECKYAVKEEESNQCYCKLLQQVWEDIAHVAMECQNIAGACLGPKGAKATDINAFKVIFNKNIIVDKIIVIIYAKKKEPMELKLQDKEGNIISLYTNFKEGTYVDKGNGLYELTFSFKKNLLNPSSNGYLFKQGEEYTLFNPSKYLYSEGGDWKYDLKNIKTVSGLIFPITISGKISDCNPLFKAPETCTGRSCSLEDLGYRSRLLRTLQTITADISRMKTREIPKR